MGCLRNVHIMTQVEQMTGHRCESPGEQPVCWSPVGDVEHAAADTEDKHKHAELFQPHVFTREKSEISRQ